MAYARAPLYHNEAGSDVVTGGSVPAGECHLCSLEMESRYDGHRVRGFCELHPSGELDAS